MSKKLHVYVVVPVAYIAKPGLVDEVRKCVKHATFVDLQVPITLEEVAIWVMPAYGEEETVTGMIWSGLKNQPEKKNGESKGLADVIEEGVQQLFNLRFPDLNATVSFERGALSKTR